MYKFSFCQCRGPTVEEIDVMVTDRLSFPWPVKQKRTKYPQIRISITHRSRSHFLQRFHPEQSHSVGQNDSGATKHDDSGDAEIRVDDRFDRQRPESLVAQVHHVVKIADEDGRLVEETGLMQRLVE